MPSRDDERPRRGPASVGRLTQAGIDAGHVLEVLHGQGATGKRWQLVCPCGWRSNTAWTRMRSFDEASEHVLRAGQRALEAAAPRAGPELQEGDPIPLRPTASWPGSEKWDEPDDRRASNSPDAG